MSKKLSVVEMDAEIDEWQFANG